MTAKNKNLKFLKEKIEQENILAPDSLSKDNIMNLLNEKSLDQPPEKTITYSKRFSWKAVVSIAACMAVIISALSINKYFTDKSNLSALSSVTEFSNYDELKETINKITEECEPFYDFTEEGVSYLAGAPKDEISPPTVLHESDEIPIIEELSSEKTYTQVNGVDEGDIIKNDGKYIYILDQSSANIKIYEANEEKADLVSTTHIIKNGVYNAYDMYLYNDKLIVNADCYIDCYYIHKNITVIYDISDKTDIKEIQSFTQDGDYISSRIIENQFYLITNKYVYMQNKLESYAPCKGIDGNSEALSLEDIYCIENPQQPSYVIAGSINLDTCDNFTDTKAILGAGNNIYCSQNNLYVYNSDYSTRNGETNILKFSLDNGAINFVTDGKVKGIVNNQYSFDEQDGNLRIATTYETSEEYNQLVVLDKNLKEIGKVDDFAKGESIQAVRYIGDTAYVITFEQTDPLFVIDLSDPKSPEIKGEVKITGFSSMLHPIDENTILGVG
ncbi:MAG: beta-propeller domain-containing protein, partial [Ruminococcus sp.]|nr:beta-propeller domain-containing protein [Ruminococcus sp.]